MILKLFYLVVMALGAFAAEVYTSGTEDYAFTSLGPLLNPLNDLAFDGPQCVSTACTTAINKNKLPTVKQMTYYNYYAASMYYGYGLEDLTCEYCQKYKDDVCDYKVLKNNTHNTLAIVTLSKTRQEIVVSFRGSENVWNLILDVLLINGSSRNGKIKIHQGFFIATMSLYDRVIRAVAEYLKLYPKYKVVITGHSLGGAISRLTYFFLEDTKQFPNVEYELYTYGEPRVGNKYFADYMNRQSITTARVVARGDVISHILPTGIVATQLLNEYYVHPQTEFWINGKENSRFCSQTVYEDPTCSMSMGPLYTFIDHFIYFDTNLGTVFGQSLQWVALPFGIMNPVDCLPPLPKPIDNLIGGVVAGVVGGLSPALG